MLLILRAARPRRRNAMGVGGCSRGGNISNNPLLLLPLLSPSKSILDGGGSPPRSTGSSPAAPTTVTIKTRAANATMRRTAVAPPATPLSSSFSFSMSMSTSMNKPWKTTTSSTTATSIGDVLPRRLSSTTGGNDGNNDNDNDEKETKEAKTEAEENYFRSDSESESYDDGLAFPPPSYLRDPVTGKWTNATLPELSVEGRRLLNLDEEGRSEAVMVRLGKRWTDANASSSSSSSSSSSTREGGEVGEVGAVDDGFGTLNDEHVRVATRVQEERMALGPIGRDPALFAASREEEGGYGERGGCEGVDTPLTSREYRALKAYAKKEHGIDAGAFADADNDDVDLIPHNFLSSGRDDVSNDTSTSFDADLDLAYLNTRMHRRAFGRASSAGGWGGSDDPFPDLLPSDLNPARKVNRRNAHPIPKRLVHHNNLSLLRRYTTPGGKIMNRVQSRLGAKDQRKIAKLVKRARHLGLIPHIGQWKFEDHGTVVRETASGGSNGGSLARNGTIGDVETSTSAVKDWEVELERRGLWPLQDSTELVKRFYDMDKILDHVAGPRGGNKRAEFDRLLGGPGALVRG